MRTAVYIAHCLNAPTREGIEANLRAGALWCACLAQHFDIAPQAPWVVLASIWHETPENSARGIECDLATIEVCRGLWMVGPRISDGMLIEARHAVACGKVVRDLTGIDIGDLASSEGLAKVVHRVHIAPAWVPPVAA